MLNIKKTIFMVTLLLLVGGFVATPSLEARTHVSFGLSLNQIFTPRHCGPCYHRPYCGPRVVPGYGYYTPAPSYVVVERPVYVEQPVYVSAPPKAIIANTRPRFYDRDRLRDSAPREQHCNTPPPSYYYPSSQPCENECSQQTPYTQSTVDRPTPMIFEMYNNGEMIQLNDGSLWKINPSEKGNVRNWMKNDAVSITQTEDSHYPYLLTNSANDLSARALMKAGPAQ